MCRVMEAVGNLEALRPAGVYKTKAAFSRCLAHKHQITRLTRQGFSELHAERTVVSIVSWRQLLPGHRRAVRRLAPLLRFGGVAVLSRQTVNKSQAVVGATRHLLEIRTIRTTQSPTQTLSLVGNYLSHPSACQVFNLPHRTETTHIW